MIFLTTNDFDSTLNAALKATLVTNNASIQDAENYAIAEARSYLAGRFDVNTIFTQTGAGRDPILVKHIIDLTIYAAQTRLAPQNIPTWVKQNKDSAIQWLKMVANNELNPDLPTIPGKSNTGTFRFGGAKKVTRRF